MRDSPPDHPTPHFESPCSYLRLAALLGVLAAVTGSSIAFGTSTTPPPIQQAASKGSAALGKKIYAVKCVACHKADGSGGIKLTGNPTPNWRDAKRMSDPKYNDDYLRECMTNGKVKSGMLPMAKQGVKVTDIDNLIAHIRTFAKK
jgi:mono/diheme cytochrome c family protein